MSIDLGRGMDEAKNRLLNFRDLTGIPDDLWKVPIDPRVTLLYPQAINISDAINRLIDRKPLNEKPINIQKFRYLSISSQVCNPENRSSQELDLVIAVKSGIAEFDRRREFRRLYSHLINSSTFKFHGLRIGLVFSLGLPRRQKDNIFLRGNRLIRLDVSGGEFLNPEDLKEINKTLKQEMEAHSDVILGDYEDTYFNLSLKTQFTLTWAATFCRKSRPIFVFLDDDVPFCERSILRSLLDLNPTERQNLFHGCPISRGQVFRFEDKKVEKWSVVKSEVPWPEYPPYLHGGFLLISFENIEKVALGMLFTRLFPIEDAWIGTIAMRLGIELKSVDKIMRRYKIFTRKSVYLNQIDKKFLKFH
nr:beta 13 n galactosyltransferase [Hymenolepis microstoma]